MADPAVTSPIPPPAPNLSASPAPTVGQRTRGIMFQYFGSLLMEPNGIAGRYVMSLGRVSLFAVLAQAMWQWNHLDRDIVPGLKETLFALMAYNFGSKGIEVVKGGIDAWKGAKAPEQPSDGPGPGVAQ